VLEDGEIVQRCQSGQTELVGILIDRYKTDLYSLCVKLTRNRPDADDLFQDTWVRVLKRLDSFSPQHKFKTWLFAICLNRYRDLYKWRKRWWRRARQVGSRRHIQDELTHIESPEPGPEHHAISEEDRTALGKAIEMLEDSFRLPILLHYFHGLSTAEISEALGIPRGTVKTRLHGGRDKLRAALEDAGHGR
jgi:RNA polymerase sigma-70 factor (ECF subfamily)